MSDITLGAKASKSGKTGIVKDENGYYEIVLGVLNSYNHAGIYYRVDDLDYLLKRTTSVLKMRLNDGILMGEYDHPSYSGMNTEEIINRTLMLDPERKVGHIKEVKFINTGRFEKGWENNPIYLVKGKVKPGGPYGKYLQEALDNPDENVAFSIRSLVRQKYIGSTLVRTIAEISTWDYVSEPGINIATQWNAAGIESRSHNEVGVCVDGVCLPTLKDVLARNEALSCETKECFLNTLNSIEEKPKILKW